MDQMTEQAAIFDCQRLITAFACFVDGGQGERLVQLFTPDGTFERRGEVLRGHDEIRAAQQRRARNVVTRHLCAPPHIELIAADRAIGITYFQLHRHAWPDAAAIGVAPLSPPEVIGEYHDEFRLTADGWRIQARVAKGVFRHTH